MKDRDLLMWILYGIGGFQLKFVSISRVINPMTCSKFDCSHWWKTYFKKSFTRFALQSECCNFNQWEHLNCIQVMWFITRLILTNFNWKPPMTWKSISKEILMCILFSFLSTYWVTYLCNIVESCLL